MPGTLDNSVVRSLYRAINERNFELFNALVSDDWADHLETGAGDKTGFINAIKQVIEALPDFNITVEQILLSPNHVTARLSLSGTQSGKFLGLAPTGCKLVFRAHDIHRMAANRIAESWQVEDWFSAFEQMILASSPHPPQCAHATSASAAGVNMRFRLSATDSLVNLPLCVESPARRP